MLKYISRGHGIFTTRHSYKEFIRTSGANFFC